MVVFAPFVGPALVHSDRARLGPARLRLGSTRPNLARLYLAWLGLARLWLGWGRPGPARTALISFARHASSPGLLGPAHLGSEPSSAPFPVVAIRSGIADNSKDKLLRPSRLEPSRLGSAWLGWGAARLSLAKPGLTRPDSGLNFSAWQLVGWAWLGWVGSACHASMRLGRSPA